MLNNESGNDQPDKDEQLMAARQLLRLQSDIAGQGQRVALAVTAFVETLKKGGNISLETMDHVKAQIMLAHLQLDELEQVLSAFG
jgi:hypothetical protein